MTGPLPPKAAGLLAASKAGAQTLPCVILSATSSASTLELATLLKRAVKEVGPVPHGYSLRSAAWSEDGTSQSQAGRYRSYNAINAIESGVVAFRSILRDAVGGEELPVLVQPTHAASISGVAALASQRSRAKSGIYIEAFYGSCKNIVDGNVAPWRFIDGSWHPGPQEDRSPYGAFRCNPGLFAVPRSLYPGVRLRPKSRPFANTPYLVSGAPQGEWLVGARTDGPVPEVAGDISSQLGRIASRMGAMPFDVEWGWDASLGVVVYQCRPLIAPVPTVSLATPQTEGAEWAAFGASGGIASGRVKTSGPNFKAGDILAVTEATNRDVRALAVSAAVISMSGGVLSHIAIAARELGIPCVTGLRSLPPTHAFVEVDGSSGCVRLIPEGSLLPG